MDQIKGAGGGGKGGSGSAHTPVDSPDTLQSVAYARVLDLVTEGPVVGLERGLKDVFIDGVALQNPDGTFNFVDVEVAWVDGSQDQDYIPGFAAQESEVGVGVQVKNVTPVVRSITNTDADQARVRISTPQLTALNGTNGDTSGTEVEIAIDIQNNGGGYVTQNLRGTGVISGTAHSAYERTFLLDLPRPGPWDIKIRRITSDALTSGDLRLSNETWFQSYTEIINDKFSYPNSSIVATKIPSKQFSAIPVRSFFMKGLIVRVPTNYTPATRNRDTGIWTPATYTGTWDGTFKLSWTSNPAWCYYDYLTSKRYGLGRYIDITAINKWALYTIARYCDGMVDDGHGGTEPRFEPRFTCNLYLQDSQEAYKVITNFASIFRAMVYWSSGSVIVAQDSPQDPSYQFNQTNVIDGKFVYQGTSKRARHTVAYVAYNDPDNHYKQTQEYVPDPTGIKRYGINPLMMTAFGCSSRGQAHRLGKWALYSERKEGDLVTFGTTLEGAYRHPGAVVDVADPKRAGKRYGGRIVSSTTTQTVIDGPGLALSESGVSYTLACVVTDGTSDTGTALEKVAITGQTNPHTIQHAALTRVPAPGAIWVITATNLAPQQFRVLTVAQSDKAEYTITAIAHDANKYAEIEQNIVLEGPPTSATPTFLPPASLAFAEYSQAAGTGTKTNLVISWPSRVQATEYSLDYRKAGGNWTPAGKSTNHEIEVLDVATGIEYSVRVAVNYSGRWSQYIVGSYTIVGKSKPPANVTGFSANLTTLGVVQMAWVPVADKDLDVYELRYGASWTAGTVIKQVKTTAFEWTPPTTNNYSLWIKAIDTSGNYSTDPANATIGLNPTTPTSITVTLV